RPRGAAGSARHWRGHCVRRAAAAAGPARRACAPGRRRDAARRGHRRPRRAGAHGGAGVCVSVREPGCRHRGAGLLHLRPVAAPGGRRARVLGGVQRGPVRGAAAADRAAPRRRRVGGRPAADQRLGVPGRAGGARDAVGHRQLGGDLRRVPRVHKGPRPGAAPEHACAAGRHHQHKRPKEHQGAGRRGARAAGRPPRHRRQYPRRDPQRVDDCRGAVPGPRRRRQRHGAAAARHCPREPRAADGAGRQPPVARARPGYCRPLPDGVKAHRRGRRRVCADACPQRRAQECHGGGGCGNGRRWVRVLRHCCWRGRRLHRIRCGRRVYRGVDWQAEQRPSCRVCGSPRGHHRQPRPVTV
ncbi:hypothetical protein IWQ56_002031, partial [Coemansia nantahalensis]